MGPVLSFSSRPFGLIILIIISVEEAIKRQTLCTSIISLIWVTHFNLHAQKRRYS